MFVLSLLIEELYKNWLQDTPYESALARRSSSALPPGSRDSGVKTALADAG